MVFPTEKLYLANKHIKFHSHSSKAYPLEVHTRTTIKDIISEAIPRSLFPFPRVHVFRSCLIQSWQKEVIDVFCFGSAAEDENVLSKFSIVDADQTPVVSR